MIMSLDELSYTELCWSCVIDLVAIMLDPTLIIFYGFFIIEIITIGFKYSKEVSIDITWRLFR